MSDVKQRFLICRPGPDFQVAPPHPEHGFSNALEKAGWEWCSADFDAFRELAKEQHAVFRGIAAEHAQLVEIEQKPGQPDMVFTADGSNSIAVNGVTYTFLSRFSNPHRVSEVDAHRAFFETLNEENRRLIEVPHNFEGTGDCVYSPYYGMFFAGYTDNPSAANASQGRSSIEAHRFVEEATGIKVKSLKLQRPLYHIDTAMAAFQHGHIMTCKAGFNAATLPKVRAEAKRVMEEEIHLPEAFIAALTRDRDAFDELLLNAGLPEESYNELRAATVEKLDLNPDKYLIHVDPWDALCLAMNIHHLGSDAIEMPRCSQKLRGEIESRGYDVKSIDIATLLAMGGGPHCSRNAIDKVHIPGGYHENPDLMPQPE